jgi:hypothetical protein
MVATERAALADRIEKTNAETELARRRLTELWAQFDRDRQAWHRRRSTEDMSASGQARELARRMKVVVAAECKAARAREDLAREISDHRRELEQLENRIGNARLRFLEHQARLLDTRHEAPDVRHEIDALVTKVSAPVPASVDQDASLQKRAESLARVAEELSDQRLHLAEQVERLLRTQQQWHSDRTAALRDLELFASRFEAREIDLDRRSRELHSAKTRLQMELQAIAQARLRSESERVRSETRLADRHAEVEARWVELDGRERALAVQEDGWRSLLRRWGRRRHQEIVRLRDVQQSCWQERAEWVNARTFWLRLVAKLRDERKAFSVQSLAVQQMRADLGGGPAVVKRLERLERQWIMQCEIEARYLERLQATVKTEAVRLDETSRRVRQDLVNSEARAALLDNRAAEVEREEQSLEAERSRLAGELDAARAREAVAEARAAGLRDETERLARLLIDAEPSPSLPSSQAA